MKFLIVFALIAVALADVEIVRQDVDVSPDGFNYAYETSDGTSAQAKGEVRNLGPEDQPIVIQGSYQYVGDDGVTYQVSYVADENGFQPQGAHLPVAPQA